MSNHSRLEQTLKVPPEQVSPCKGKGWRGKEPERDKRDENREERWGREEVGTGLGKGWTW